MFRRVASAASVAAADAGDPVGNVYGAPTWTYLLLDHNGGIAAMDRSGAAAWDCPGIGQAKDLLPSGHLVVVHLGDALAEVDAACQIVAKGSWVVDGHEARIDGIDGNRVLGINNDGCKNRANVSCDGVISWDRSTGEDAMVIDLGDHFDPATDWGTLSVAADWMHTNYVTTGLDRNFLVGMRELSAVASFDYDTYEKQWVISSEIASNFTFDREESKFFNPHDGQQLPDGNLLLFDNGNVRNDNASAPFSRAVEYTLDFQTMTVSLVWEYRVAECGAMGSARRLANGNTVVHCPQCATGVYPNQHTGVIYEVDAAGVEVSRVEILSHFTTYRAQPVESLPHLVDEATLMV